MAKPASDRRRARRRSWVDAEVAGEHGTTALPASRTDEAHPEIVPQTPGGAVRKLRAETAAGKDLTGKAKRAAEELDRQLAGEYERREDPAMRPPRPGRRSGQRSRGA
jgi:hypothetical protein